MRVRPSACNDTVTNNGTRHDPRWDRPDSGQESASERVPPRADHPPITRRRASPEPTSRLNPAPETPALVQASKPGAMIARRARVVLALLLSLCPPALAAQAPAVRATCGTPPADTRAAVTRIPIEISNNHVYVTLCSDRRAFDFLVDTGAGQTFFDLETARALGAEFGPSFRARGGGAGTAAGAAVRTPPLTLAGTAITLPVTRAIDFSGLTPREGRRIEGVIGHDFIRRFVVALDYVNREMQLHDRSSFTYTGSGSSVPLTFANNHPHVQAEIELADGERLSGVFVVDVGSSLALSLARPFVEQHRLRERVGPTIRRPAGGGIGGPATADHGRVPIFRIGGVELRGVVTQMFGDDAGVFSGNGAWVGNIGSDVLRRFTVFLDYEGGRMILEPHARTGEPFEADMSGATLIGNAEFTQILVDFVLPGSAAAQAGLAQGDVITAVDGRALEPRTLITLRDRLRRAGESVALSVRRGTEATVIRLTTRRIL